jgi:fatty-acyl-CoA synthase
LSRPLIFTEAVAAHAASFPGKTALIDAAGPVTYGELWSSVTSIAASLAGRGIGRDDMVAVALEPSVEQAAALLGVMAAGAVACPLNIRLAPPEVATFLGPMGPKLAIASERHGGLARAAGAPPVTLAELTAGPPGTPAPIDERQPMLVVGTGGTTGIPKAATYSHRGVWAWCATCGHIQEMRQEDVHLYLSPFFHSTLVTNLLTPLFTGATVHVLPGYDEEAIVAGLNTDRYTWLYAAPTVLTRLLDAPGLRRGREGALRVIAFGSMKSQPEMPGRLREAFPRIRLITGYGTTEFGPISRIKGDEIGREPSCVGRPVPGARIEIRGPSGDRLPLGTDGEIVVWCPWQMEGYWGRPDQTAEVLVDGGVQPGDIGAFDESGRLYLRGRSKEAIVSGGENVWPAEVETALLAHPALIDVVVYGVDDPVWGERVEAAVVLAAGSAIGLDDLRAFGREQIASYKLPRSVRVVAAIPLTPLSKPDRAALRRAAAAAPLPDMAAGAR